jgi:hypothetical protein
MTHGRQTGAGGAATAARMVMAKHLAGVVGDVLQRSRRLRTQAAELCAFTRELHDSLANRTRCPVCGSAGVRHIYRANLSGKEQASVLARRCPQGHVYTSLSSSDLSPE